MTFLDIIIIIVVIVAAIIGILYFLNKKAAIKMEEQQNIIKNAKQSASIFVIDKKRGKIGDVNMPKVVLEQMPKHYKFLKLNFIQAKIGAQIITLMCDKKVFEAMPIKKNVKVELAGIYIVSLSGMKSDEEMKKIKATKKEKQKQLKLQEKNKK